MLIRRADGEALRPATVRTVRVLRSMMMERAGRGEDERREREKAEGRGRGQMSIEEVSRE